MRKAAENASRRAISVTTKLVVVMVAVAVVPLAALSAFLLVFQRATLTNEAMERFDALAEVQQARVEAYLDANATNLALVTSRTQLRRNLRLLLDTGDREAREQANRILEDARDATPGVVQMSAVGPDAVVLASTEHEEIGEDRSGVPHVEQGLSATTLSHVDRLADGRLANVVAGPMSLEGRMLGAAVVVFDLKPLLALVEDRSGLGETGETLIAQRTPTGGASYITPLRFDRDAALRRRVSPDATDAPMIAALRGVETTVPEAPDYRGETVVAAARSIPDVGWGLVVKRDRAELLAPVDHLERNLIIVVVVVALVAALGAMVLGRRQNASLRELIAGARALAAGDRNRRVKIDSNDEIGELGQVFNDMADEVASTQRELEKHVRARTAELDRAREALARRNEDLESFTRLLAHDLKAPLTIAMGFAKLMANPKATEDARKDAIVEVNSSLVAMKELVEDILDYLQAETATLEAHEVDLKRLVEEAAAECGANGHVVVAESLPSVVGDDRFLRRVIANLLGNAVKYSRHGVPPRVEVTARRDGEIVALAIADNGVGVPPHERDRIFEPFERSSATAHVRGTGIGLAICRAIVEHHGGSIRCRANDPAGTVFEVRLPAPGDETAAPRARVVAGDRVAS